MRNSWKSVSDKFVSPDSPQSLELVEDPVGGDNHPVKALSLGGPYLSVKEV
jgi:hypothetical protein